MSVQEKRGRIIFSPSAKCRPLEREQLARLTWHCLMLTLHLQIGSWQEDKMSISKKFKRMDLNQPMGIQPDNQWLGYPDNELTWKSMELMKKINILALQIADASRRGDSEISCRSVGVDVWGRATCNKPVLHHKPNHRLPLAPSNWGIHSPSLSGQPGFDIKIVDYSHSCKLGSIEATCATWWHYHQPHENFV